MTNITLVVDSSHIRCIGLRFRVFGSFGFKGLVLVKHFLLARLNISRFFDMGVFRHGGVQESCAFFFSQVPGFYP